MLSQRHCVLTLTLLTPCWPPVGPLLALGTPNIDDDEDHVDLRFIAMLFMVQDQERNGFIDILLVVHCKHREPQTTVVSQAA